MTEMMEVRCPCCGKIEMKPLHDLQADEETCVLCFYGGEEGIRQEFGTEVSK